ncbi:hypothetical protein SDC9_130666 [bioreactor metagenome]|uniref:Uncharacterized protein n=1 Tax=bioreactor metagenome TaxID=1076179 RepID=A0A645D358_9ZZZZ
MIRINCNQVIVDRWGGGSYSCQVEKTMIGEVYKRSLVCCGTVFYNQSIAFFINLVSHCNFQISGEAFFTVY